ncbi:DUF4105 domain-containing protein [Aestuariivirga sp.]|uniref:Lnb N-terminal periplasmic domain-containing protein n=1 Tax=Aestuariivirga sp. TaxID=2650926 RepID=UPI00359393EB
MRRFISILLLILALAALAILIASAWATLALWYRLPVPDWGKGLAATLFALAGLATIVGLFRGPRLRSLTVFGVLFGAVLIWWGTIKPVADADWAPDVARQVTGTVNGDLLTLTNVRAFAWRNRTDSTEVWSTRSYDMSTLKSLDLFLSYWGNPNMAHVMMSFGFEGGDYLAWSVEVRRTRNGVFSPIADLFKSNPLVIIAAEERDVIGVRSNFRGEDVQLYRLRAKPALARELLVEYVLDANELAVTPAFYNSLTSNCATTVFKLVRAVGDKLPMDWRLVVDGYLPGYLYDQGSIDIRLPLDELIARSHIDAHAKKAGLTAEYSRLIRVGVPSPHEQ